MSWWSWLLVGAGAAVVPWGVGIGLLAYLLLPFDLVPDFLPIAGQLDDVIVVGLMRYLLRSAGASLVEEHWPGPPESLAAVVRPAFGRDRVPSTAGL